MCYQMVAGLAQMGVQQFGQTQNEIAGAGTARNNATIAGMKEDDALSSGVFQQEVQHEKTAQIIGAQRAAMGASGAVVDVGSGADALADTATAGAQDEATIRSNSLKQAWGFEQEKQNYLAQADSLDQAAMINKGFLSAGQSLQPGWMSKLNPIMDWGMRGAGWKQDDKTSLGKKINAGLPS